MTEEIISPIPSRLKNVAVGGHVAGAVDIIDDDLMLTQAEINDIVLGDALKVSLIADKTAVFVGESTNIELTATISSKANKIVIKRGKTQIGEEELNNTFCVRTDTGITPDAVGNLTYTAYFTKGGKQKEATKNVPVVKPIYYGGGAAYTDITNRASARTNAAGYTYTISLASTTYIWFIIPSDMSNVKATMGPLEFPLDAPDTTSMSGYKIYRSSTPHATGSYSIALSVSN